MKFGLFRHVGLLKLSLAYKKEEMSGGRRGRETSDEGVTAVAQE